MEYSVLLVDGNPEDRSRVVLALARAAPHVHLSVVEDGERARAYLSGTGTYADRDWYPMPQLILLDLRHLEVLEWLRGQPDLPPIPVIVMASSRASSDVDRAYSMGANACLLKTAEEDLMLDFARGVGDYAALLQERSRRNSRQCAAASDDLPASVALPE